MKTIRFWIAWLLVVGALLLVGCGAATPAVSPTAATTASPPPPSPTAASHATAAFTPSLPTPAATPSAAATRPWTQGSAWPTPTTSLELTVSAPKAPSPDLWRSALAEASYGDEFWLGKEAPSTWNGVKFPSAMHILVTDKRFTPSAVVEDVLFTIAPEDLPLLQQAFSQAGWKPLHNINPDLAQFATGAVLLDLYRNGNSQDENQVSIFLVRVAGEKELWGRISVPSAVVMAPVSAPPPPSPWGIALPKGWQSNGMVAQWKARGGGVEVSVWRLVPGKTSAEDAFAAWNAYMEQQGWQKTADGLQGMVKWMAWKQGDDRRSLALAPSPLGNESLLVAYAFPAGAEKPHAKPVWHGTLTDEQGRKAALLALLFVDPQFTSPLSLSLGSLPEGDWPLADSATMVFGRKSSELSIAWLGTGDSPGEVVKALEEGGWNWGADRNAALAALGAPWPEMAVLGNTPTLIGAVCKGDKGYLARISPSGMVNFVGIPTVCGKSPLDAPPEFRRILPKPDGYPLKAYAMFSVGYSANNPIRNGDMALFWMPRSSNDAAGWLQQVAESLQKRGWHIADTSPEAVVANLDKGTAITVFVLPVFDDMSLYGVLVER